MARNYHFSWHPITSTHRHKIFIHCILFNFSCNTRKRSLDWNPYSTRHHSASTFKTCNKTKKIIFFIYFLFFLETGSLSRQSCCPWDLVSHAQAIGRAHGRRVALHGRACRFSYAHAAGLPFWLACDLENLIATSLSRDPKYQFSSQFWTVHSVPNISTFNPKILGLNIRATHGPGELKPCH